MRRTAAKPQPHIFTNLRLRACGRPQPHVRNLPLEELALQREGANGKDTFVAKDFFGRPRFRSRTLSPSRLPAPRTVDCTVEVQQMRRKPTSGAAIGRADRLHGGGVVPLAWDEVRPSLYSFRVGEVLRLQHKLPSTRVEQR